MVLDDAESMSAVLRPVGTPQSLRTRKIRGRGSWRVCLLAHGPPREQSSLVKGERLLHYRRRRFKVPERGIVRTFESESE
jgi:hypothetical protein